MDHTLDLFLMLVDSCNLLLQPLCPSGILCLQTCRKQDIFLQWGYVPKCQACTVWSGPSHSDKHKIILKQKTSKIFTLKCSMTPAVVEVGWIRTNPKHLVGWAIPNLNQIHILYSSSWNFNLWVPSTLLEYWLRLPRPVRPWTRPWAGPGRRRGPPPGPACSGTSRPPPRLQSQSLDQEELRGWKLTWN